MKPGGASVYARPAIIATLVLLVALVPRSASSFDADPYSRWWSNNVAHYFEASVPVEWHSYISQAADAWEMGSANSWLAMFPYYPGAPSYGFLTRDETNNWFNCWQEVFACVQPPPSSRYFFDGDPMRTVYDDDVNWITQGPDDCGTFPPTINIKNVSLHEFGHWLRLWDQPAGHPEAVMSWGCDNKNTLRQDDRDGDQYLYGTEYFWGPGYATGGFTSQLLVPGGQPNWLWVYGTSTTPAYWQAWGRGTGAYVLGPVVNAGANSQWWIDVEVVLNSASGTAWHPALVLLDSGGNYIQVGWYGGTETGWPNTSWFLESSVGSVYWGNGSSAGSTHHLSLSYDPATKYVTWVADGTFMWWGYVPLNYPQVIVQGQVRAQGDSMDVTFKNFRVRTL